VKAKIKSRAALVRLVRGLQRRGKQVVFANGCFDLLHVGHVRLLAAAKKLGDVLVVAVNSDRSVRSLGKGPGRPLVPEAERAELVAALGMVDYVVIFGESTPRALIRALLPDVLVKGGDWKPDQVVGREEVEAAGGRVVIVPYLEGRSTSSIIRRSVGPKSGAGQKRRK
jgi:rfaE bifunctional protein nucleotidyltransferase chain/domain